MDAEVGFLHRSSNAEMHVLYWRWWAQWKGRSGLPQPRNGPPEDSTLGYPVSILEVTVRIPMIWDPKLILEMHNLIG